MIYTVDGATFKGTPSEIADLLETLYQLQNEGKTQEPVEGETPPVPGPAPSFPQEDFQPLDNLVDVVSESADIRIKLAKDPAYNPFPGVSPSPESVQSSEILLPSSELDTGVELR